MIQKLKLKNFRNFSFAEFLFCDKKNFIIWENWKWKTNLLESISLLSLNKLNKIDFKNLVWNQSNTFFIELIDTNWNTISISYNKDENKKQYLLNWKKTTKSKIKNISPKCVNFSPITMNMMYLWPSLRRDFLDQILLNTFDKYNIALKEYKNILNSRNKTLKAIRDWKINENELDFWDNKFIYISKIIYNYRFWLNKYFKENISQAKKYFFWKIEKTEFIYKTKIQEDIEKDIQNYLSKNRQRDIILANTSIWPHIDDFDILLDWKSLIEFASRWETKSIIIELKFLEIKFIEKYSEKRPILLIDDFLSELDEKHKNLILEELKGYQTFITSIKNQEDYTNPIILN
jgi:DNA replication and repair protein RecF